MAGTATGSANADPISGVAAGGGPGAVDGDGVDPDEQPTSATAATSPARIFGRRCGVRIDIRRSNHAGVGRSGVSGPGGSSSRSGSNWLLARNMKKKITQPIAAMKIQLTSR